MDVSQYIKASKTVLSSALQYRPQASFLSRPLKAAALAGIEIKQEQHESVSTLVGNGNKNSFTLICGLWLNNKDPISSSLP